MTPKHDALDGKQITLVDAGVKEGKVSSCLSGLTENFSVPSKVDEVVGIRRRQRVGATFAVGGVGERQGCMGTCVGVIDGWLRGIE